MIYYVSIMTEVFAASYTVEFAKKLKRQKGPDKMPWRKSKGVSRRNLVIGLAAGGAAVATAAVLLGRNQQPPEPSLPKPVGTIPERKPTPKDNPYAGWERYQNKPLPKEIVLKIGQDLAKDTQYPGFKEVGELIILAQEHPEQLQKYLSGAKTSVGISLAETVPERGALGYLVYHPVTTEIAAKTKDKRTGDIKDGVFIKWDKVDLKVELDNSYIFSPNIFKKLIIVKEYSHLLYHPQHKDKIIQEVLDHYEILKPTADLNIPNLLYQTALHEERNTPVSGALFSQAKYDADGAGYWHIMPAYGKMKALGMVNAQSLDVLENDDRAFETARKRGLLIEKNKGEFVWKEGIGPFSPEWTQITRAILTDKQP